jgi:3-hydroxy-3-methylglutaryl CoA synthase/uncharacterized OB-fold protein
MTGITRLGTYFPRRRLDRGLIAKAWGGRASGSRTVAAADEDALTMAVEACMACGEGGGPVDAVHFASTSAPYLEKQIASVVATALDLPRTTVVADFAGSLRSGVAALRAALDGVAAGSLGRVFAVAADIRLAEPESPLETQLGDGAACVEIGQGDVVAELVSSASIAQEFTHFWRTDGQRYVQVSDARFGNQYGYGVDVPEVVAAALRKAELPPEKVAAYALAAPDARAAAAAAKRIGANPETQLVAPLTAETGRVGAPEPFVQLSRALETATPGDFLVMAAYGEGADALVFRATAALPRARPRPLAETLAGGMPVASYEKYLRARSILPADVGGEFFSTYMEWKELRQDLRLYGSRCEACGLVQYPQNRVCHQCKARDRMAEHKLAKRGTVFTFTIDNLIGQVAEHPMPMVVVDLDGGGRVYMQGTDCAEGDIAVGTTVRLTYRRLHEAGGNRNYYWKVRPA